MIDPLDAELLAHARPADWVNPVPVGRYNLVVLGAGTAGLVCAAGAAGLGARVALIERDRLGGDCLNSGCVPSKALLAAARAAAAVRDAGRFGIQVPAGVRVDFPAVMARLRRLRAELAVNDSAPRFRGLGVDVFLGQGRFVGPRTIEVSGQRLDFAGAVIATGARAARPDIPGLESAGYLTNETIFSITQLPPRLAVIGAGPIGCELAQAFARLGSRVTLLANHERILPHEDARATAFVEQSLRRDGIELVLRCQVQQAQRQGMETVLSVVSAGQARQVRADAVLVGVGRTPNVEGLNLEAASVEYDQHNGVKVDDRLRTTNPRVFAAGDICSRFKFTHAADAMARIVIQNALFLGRARVSALTIPWCTYTDPEIAHVGLHEDEARAQGLAVDVFEQDFRQVDRAVLDGEAEGFARVLVKKGSQRIVGATIVARHAGDLIAEISLAMTARLGLKTLASTIHPYPTQAEALKKLGDAWNRTRLTPWLKNLFQRWLRWSRS